MAPNNSQDIQTVPGNATSTPSENEKRKSSKKTSAPLRTTKKSAPADPKEIVFKELANPHKPAVPPYIWIDHPLPHERLLAPTYVIRLGVGGAETVELSIDKGPWRSCRLTSGYWWFDWDAVAPGKHVLVARMKALDGRWFRTPPCSCDYRP